MKLQTIFGSAVLVLVAMTGTSAWAADSCGPLALISSVDLIPDGGRFLVPVTIGAKSTKMIFDTGSGITNVNPSATEGLGLQQISDARFRMLDSTGNASTRYVGLDNFVVGAIHTNHIQFMVAPSSEGTGEIAGSLAGDILQFYDVELDFAAKKLNFFSKSHCPGKVIYWHPAAVAQIPFSVFQPTGDASRTGYREYADRSTHIWVPVTLDGKKFQAMIDTGASSSTISAGIAKANFGISADDPGTKILGTVNNDPNNKVFEHVFSALTFDGVTVTNPHFAVRPNLFGKRDPDNSNRTDTRIRKIDDNIGFDITIGMDVLRKLHLFIAFSEKNLYVTPGAPPTAPAQ